MNVHKQTYFLNEVAIALIMRFLHRHIRSKNDLNKFNECYFDLPQFEIDLCKAIDDFLVRYGCTKHLAWTANFTCRGRSTVDRNIKKHPL